MESIGPKSLVRQPRLAKTLVRQAWEKHRTVIVCGQVSRAAWFPPVPEADLPGVLVAPGPAAARKMLRELPELLHRWASMPVLPA
jgi:hypothetical protein